MKTCKCSQLKDSLIGELIEILTTKKFIKPEIGAASLTGKNIFIGYLEKNLEVALYTLLAEKLEEMEKTSKDMEEELCFFEDPQDMFFELAYRCKTHTRMCNIIYDLLVIEVEKRIDLPEIQGMRPAFFEDFSIYMIEDCPPVLIFSEEEGDPKDMDNLKEPIAKSSDQTIH